MTNKDKYYLIIVLQKHSQITAIILVLSLWWVLTYFELVGNTLLASPLEVFEAITATDKKVGVWQHAVETFLRAMQGWSVAIVLGTIAGVLIGKSKSLFLASEPLIEFSRSIPPVIFFPLLLVPFNEGVDAYIWTIAIGCIPVMILAVARGTQQISIAKLELLKMHKVHNAIRFSVLIMEILPGLFFGARITLSIAIVISVVTEMITAPETPGALGKMAQNALMAFETPDYFAAVLIIGTFGYLSNISLRILEAKIGNHTSMEIPDFPSNA